MAGWFAHTLRPAMLAAGRSDRLGRIVERSPLTRGVVRRFVPGDTLDDVVDIVTALRDSGRYLSIDYLGENVTDADDAAAAVRAYLGLLDVLGRRGDIACDGVRPLEVSLKLSALGQALDRDGQKIALDNARAICERAERVGAWVTVDAEDHTTTDSTLSTICASTFLGWARLCRPICGARWPIARSWRPWAPESGCARAPMTNPHRWPTETPRRSPTPICGAFGY